MIRNTADHLEKLHFLLVGEALDVGSFDVCLQAELLPGEQGKGAVKGHLHVCYLLLQPLLLILQLAILHCSTDLSFLLLPLLLLLLLFLVLILLLLLRYFKLVNEQYNTLENEL